MNAYTELWNYAIDVASLPYAYNNGNPYTSGGFCYLPVNSFVNKDFAGSAWTFQGYNYVGHHALTFTLDTANAGEGSIFTILCYGGSTPGVPAIQRTASGVALGWTTYSNSFMPDSGNGSTATGQFNGAAVDETGVYTVVFLKIVNGTENDVAMHVTSPSGVHYFSGWSTVVDDVQHIQIGNNTSGSGEWIIGPLSVNDDLTVEEAELLRTTGALTPKCATPTFNPGNGSYDFSVDVELACATPDSTIYYTTDGSAPTSSSSVYSTAIHLTANTTVRAFATAAGVDDSAIASANYVIVTNPICVKPVIAVTGSGATRDVTITCATPSATIYYTLDGSNPNSSSTLYTGSFQVDESATIKAVATKTLYRRSPYAAWSALIKFGSAVILGHAYLTVVMPDGKEWLDENLAYDVVGYDYGDTPSNNIEYGRLYSASDLATVVALLTSGWHLPTEADSIALVSAIGGVSSALKLKSPGTTYWTTSNGTNNYGFDARGSGWYNGSSYLDLTLGFYIWLDLSSGSYNKIFGFSDSATVAGNGGAGANDRYSVRLVREKCVNPEISRLSGSYVDSSIDVKLTCPDENAKFFYTTNGDDPTESSTPYTGPINVSSSLTLKVIATNGVPSDVVSVTYVLNATISQTRELTVPWSNADDLWVTRGAVTFNAGVLSADAANGHASWLPAYGTPTQRDASQYQNSDKNFIACYEYDIELAANSTLVFGLNENKTYLSFPERTFEFYRESDAAVRFVVRRGTLAGFDGTLTVGSRFKLRLALNGHSENYLGNYSSTSPVRLSVVTQDGTVVADSDWKTFDWFVPNYVQDSWFSQHPYYGTPAFALKRGQVTMRPFRVVSPCPQAQCVEFITTGSTTVAPVPSAPQFSVTKLHDGLNRVIITPASYDDSMIITVDEGYFTASAFDIVRNKRAIFMAPGELFVKVVAGQCVFRAISASRERSTSGFSAGERRSYAHVSVIATQAVGDSLVTIPEITPRRDELVPGYSTPVNVYCADADVTIRYTIDGSEPTALSPVWAGTMQVREPLWLRVKTFKGSESSPTQNGLYAFRGEPMQLLPSTADTSLWVGTNATFAAGGITIDDPNGSGVVLRDDIAINTTHLDVSCLRFRVSGPFRMRIPGTNGAHLAWVGDKIGLVTDTSEEPNADFIAQSYADVSVAFSDYIVVYHPEIPAVLRYAMININGNNASVTVDLTAPTLEAANKLGFTSEGLSSYMISNLEIIRIGSKTFELQDKSTWTSLLSGAYPLARSDKPVFDTYADNNIVGQPVVAANSTSMACDFSYIENADPSSSTFSSSPTLMPTGYNNGYALVAAMNLETGKLSRVAWHAFNGARPFECNMSTWDRVHSWTSHYVITSGYGANGIDLVEQPSQLTNERWRLGRRWATTKLINPVDMAGNAWFSFEARSMYNDAYIEEHRPEYDVAVGFDTPMGIAMPVLSSRPLKGIDAGRITNATSSMFEIAKIIRLCNLETFETAPGAHVASTAGNHSNVFANWRCGRKIVAGVLYVRVAAWHDWQFKPFYDSGWINCGAASTQPRPRIIVRTRTLDGSWFPLHLVNCFYGHDNLQEAELEELFDYGALSVPAAPVLTAANTLNSDGTVDVTLTAPGSSRVLVCIGDQEPQVRVDASDNSGMSKNYYRRRAWYYASSGNGNTKQDDDFFVIDPGPQSLGGHVSYSITDTNLSSEQKRVSVRGSSNLFIMSNYLCRIESNGSLTWLIFAYESNAGDVFVEGTLHSDGLVYMTSWAENAVGIYDVANQTFNEPIYVQWYVDVPGFSGNAGSIASDPETGRLLVHDQGAGIFEVQPYGSSALLAYVATRITLDSSFDQNNTTMWFWGQYLFVCKDEDTTIYIYDKTTWTLYTTATKNAYDFMVFSGTKWFTLRYVSGTGVKVYERDLDHLSAVEESKLIDTIVVTPNGSPKIVGATVDGESILVVLAGVDDPKVYRVSLLTGVVPGGVTFQVPALSKVRAVALAEPYTRYVAISGNNNQFTWYAKHSAFGSLEVKRPASDLISISTAEPLTAVIRFAPPANMFTLEYSSDDWSIAMAHSYKLVFDDGFEFELQAWTYTGYERPNDLTRQLAPGQHWVKLVRYKTTGVFGNYVLGESDRLLFTVSESLSLQTATPSSVVAGATAVFSAAGGGSSFSWFFSDGSTATGAIVNKTFEKPGRYSWRVVADDGKEQCQSSGSFVVTFTTSALPENMTSTEELRIS